MKLVDIFPRSSEAVDAINFPFNSLNSPTRGIKFFTSDYLEGGCIDGGVGGVGVGWL